MRKKMRKYEQKMSRIKSSEIIQKFQIKKQCDLITIQMICPAFTLFEVIEFSEPQHGLKKSSGTIDFILIWICFLHTLCRKEEGWCPMIYKR